MMNHFKTLKSQLCPLLFLALVCLSHSSEAAEHDYQKMAWLQGCWQGTGLGGQVSECWLKSDDNLYTSVFQMTKNGKQVFNEIVMIGDFDGEPAMRVKHFSPDFVQWESDNGKYVEFPLTAIKHQHIIFEGVEYKLEGQQLKVRVSVKGENGEIRDMYFDMQRMASN